MEAKEKQGWTDEDKAWAIGGAVAVVAGGIYWYLKNKKAADTIAPDGTDTTVYKDSTTTKAVIGSDSSSSSSSTPASAPATATRTGDPIKYSVGQEMMAIGSTGTPTYDTVKAADGNYTRTGILGKNFANGMLIGKIIWVGILADGTYRYVIEEKTLFSSTLRWVADYRLIKPTNGSKGISTTGSATTSSLNTTLVLKKGSKGNEVRNLQKRLGVTVDGDFGANTLAALQAQKAVSQITLATFNTTTSGLNFNLILKSGSKGLEVKELQKRLGFTGSNVDGDFGAKTESALFAMKGVKQTTLNQFSFV